MSREQDEDGWIGVLAIARMLLGVLTLPVVAGFVALGVAVVAGRSLRGVAWDVVLRHVPGLTAPETTPHRRAA